VDLLICYHLDHSARCAVFKHRAPGAVRGVTEYRPVSLLTQKHERSHSLFDTLLCHVSAGRSAIKLETCRNSPHISYYFSCSL
jgi:hypothetical protein